MASFDTSEPVTEIVRAVQSSRKSRCFLRGIGSLGDAVGDGRQVEVIDGVEVGDGADAADEVEVRDAADARDGVVGVSPPLGWWGGRFEGVGVAGRGR
ncbi:hypothetical protein [Nonomuraea cypriaca]|uniref:hypothetical protein n=1 Tax=Nonomuraea cypriaca TaxID=1187855 RepID=UPI001F27853E|nr:hypothetical protein [Nonomuraea cypriaca]